jgi:hypothetical protein
MTVLGNLTIRPFRELNVLKHTNNHVALVCICTLQTMLTVCAIRIKLCITESAIDNLAVNAGSASRLGCKVAVEAIAKVILETVMEHDNPWEYNAALDCLAVLSDHLIVDLDTRLRPTINSDFV